MSDVKRPVAVRTRDRRTQPLGRFLDGLAKRAGRPVTEIARDAQVSRAYYYVLRDSDKTPSIETLANLLTSLGVDFRLGDLEDDAEFVVRTDGDEWRVRLPYEGKRAARALGVRNMTYASSLPNKPPQPTTGDAEPGEPLYALGPVRETGTSAEHHDRRRTFVVGHSSSRRDRSAEENRLLSELVTAAGELNADHLEHLLATARLLASKDD